jgi:hypothetical protein
LVVKILFISSNNGDTTDDVVYVVYGLFTLFDGAGLYVAVRGGGGDRVEVVVDGITGLFGDCSEGARFTGSIEFVEVVVKYSRLGYHPPK